MKSKDLISNLPKDVIGHILSFLPTKKAASTSVLSKKWRYLFALSPILELVSSKRLIVNRKYKVSPSFFDFVDRLLALQANSLVHKFSLQIVEDSFKYPVDFTRIVGWILNVLERGVSDVKLKLYFDPESLLPSEIFLSKTLVTMKLAKEDRGCFGEGPTIDVEDAYLPKLKSLYLDLVYIKNQSVGLVKLLSGCHMLEDLVLKLKSPYSWDYTSVYVSTLKRLRFYSDKIDYNPKSVSFDTPNLVYLEYTDTIADKYPKLNFGSLVEAKVDLRMSVEQNELADLREEAQLHYAEGHEENELIGNATDFIMAICNVKILYLYADTLQVLAHCCEALPVFNNLTHLTIANSPVVGWQSLPRLLKNSPNLETLVFETLAHKATNGCGAMCLCKPYEAEEISTCLSSSPVKVFKIKMFGAWSHYPVEKQIEQVKHFLETMPNLEQLIIYYVTSVVEDVIELSSQLRTIDNVASSKCIVQVIQQSFIR